MNILHGIGRYIRLILRRDRVLLLVWIFGSAVLFMAFAAATIDAYPTAHDWLMHAQANNPIVVSRLFNGVIYGVNQGATIMSETLIFMTLFPALMSIFAITRHTRQNEELGRTELVHATAVSRYADLIAALLVVCAANILLGVSSALGLIAVGLDASGSFAAGGVLAAVGIAFTGITALAAQLMSSARATNAIAGAFLGVAFVVRGVGDAMGVVSADGLTTTSAWPIWLSPIGWTEKVFPYIQNNWLYVVLPCAFGVAASGFAFWLMSRRDIGAGIVSPRKGPATASRNLLSAFGLAWRLQRGAFYGWLAAMIVLGLTMGAVADQVNAAIDASPSLGEALGQLGGAEGLTKAYFVLVMNIIGVAAAGFVVQGLLQLRSEESNGRLEPLLSVSLGRLRWILSHLSIAVAGVVLIIILTGVSVGLAYGLIIHDVANQTLEQVKLALLQLPALVAIAGIVVFVFGCLPRGVIAVSWSYLTACLLIMYVGLVLNLPQWLINSSPFSHVPANYSWPELKSGLPLIVIAVLLFACGVLMFRKRNLTLS